MNKQYDEMRPKLLFDCSKIEAGSPLFILVWGSGFHWENVLHFDICLRAGQRMKASRAYTNYFPLRPSWLCYREALGNSNILSSPISAFSVASSTSFGKLWLVKFSRLERGEAHFTRFSIGEESALFLNTGVSLFGCGAFRMASMEKGNTLLLVSLSFCWSQFLPFKIEVHVEGELPPVLCLSMRGFFRPKTKIFSFSLWSHVARSSTDWRSQ